MVRKQQRGALLTEAAIALAILVTVMIPFSASVWHEQALCRAYYHRAIAMEIVDGEMEALAAGEWQSFKPGSQVYPIRANALTNLPPGRFVLTLSEQVLRLEWIPEQRDQGGKVVREVKFGALKNRPEGKSKKGGISE